MKTVCTQKNLLEIWMDLKLMNCDCSLL